MIRSINYSLFNSLFSVEPGAFVKKCLLNKLDNKLDIMRNDVGVAKDRGGDVKLLKLYKEYYDPIRKSS